MSSHRRSGFWERLKKFLFPPNHNLYLQQHGFFASFDEREYARSPELYPYLPYSLQDVIENKRLTGFNILVASHTSTARWLSRRKNTVTLGRISYASRRKFQIRMLNDFREYNGQKLDVLIWDSRRRPENLTNFIESKLSPTGIVIIVYTDRAAALKSGFDAIGEALVARKMKCLEFQNPGPRNEIMTAELYYPQDNVLNI